MVHRDDLMRPDLMSEILLLASGIVLFLPLLIVLFAALTGSEAGR